MVTCSSSLENGLKLATSSEDIWPGSEYFIDFQHGDPWSKIPDAEMRLPSSAYDRLYNVRKDAYGNYSAFDRYRILADVAPYSEEYRMARKEVTILNQAGLLDERQQAEYREIREQVTSKNVRKEFHPDRFRDIDVSYRTVTVDKIIDQNNFLVKEFPNNPIRLAGVKIKSDDEENVNLMEQMLKPGRKIKIAIDNNPQTRIRDDMYDSIRAVVYAPETEVNLWDSFFNNSVNKGQNLNYYLSQQENVSVKDDGTDISTLATFNEGEIAIGAFGNWLRRDIISNVPVLNVAANIFMPVDDAVSSYEKEIFSRSWRSWDDPIKGWLQPMVERLSSQNPVLAALHGGGFGAMLYKGNRWKGFWIGAAVQGTLAGIRTMSDIAPREDKYDIWKPERRETEFEINEYFDRMTYVKYKGLYNQAIEMAKEEEGIDLKRIFKIQEDRNIKDEKTYLLERKKWLTIEKKTRSERFQVRIDEELDELKEKLAYLGSEEALAEVGPYTALALRYKDIYESTLYAAAQGETYDYTKIYRALPYKDRPYFNEFVNAKPKDRQRILELVPDNQRPIYQRYFGMEQDKVESNQEYFKRYHLPNANWEGWEAGHSLDNVKMKIMRQEGIDLTEANYWPEQEAIADEYGLDVDFQYDNPGSIFDRIDTNELTKILQGKGLEDVRINFVTGQSDSPAFNLNLNIERDRKREVESGLSQYLQFNM